ncbi:glycosyltransferase [Aeromonas caviae]
MKILKIRHSLHGGGAERVVIELASTMRRENVSVTIYITDNVVSYDIPEGVSLVKARLPRFVVKLEFLLKKLMGSFAYIITAPFHIYYLKRTLDIAQFDKIFIHSISSILPFLFLRGSNVYNVYHCAKSNLLLAGRTKFGYWKNRTMLRLSQRGKNAIAVSKGVAFDLDEKFNIKTDKVIYNPFDFLEIKRLSREDSVGLLKYGKYILNIGRLNHQKNQKEFIEAFSLLSPELYDSAVILGDGSDKQSLIQYAKTLGVSERVFFVGFHSNPYVFMRCSQALVLTSKFEGFGNVLVEALACGCPVVSANCNYGPNEILVNELAKYLYEPGDIKALADILGSLKKDNYPFHCFNEKSFSVELSARKYIKD